MDLAYCLGSGQAQHDLRKSPHPVVSGPPLHDEEQMAQENTVVNDRKRGSKLATF
jgi:hypothetical protein